MKKFYIETFGCQMNVHDSEKICGSLMQSGMSRCNTPSEADLIVINTCSIRQKAEDKFFSYLGRLKPLKRKNPDLKLAVTGCIAQREGQNIYKKAPFVDYVIGTQNIKLFRELTNIPLKQVYNNHCDNIDELELQAVRSSAVSAYINIIYGCNNFCSYCVVPFTRGPERSRKTQAIISEIKHHLASGAKEIILLGQNVNSYKEELDFAGLLHAIDAISGDFWVRFVTSHPKDLNDAVIDAIANLPKICKHIHLPLQSGSNRILSMMNRKYTIEDYYEKIHKLKKLIKNIAITTDIIAGFPTETEDDHKQTLQALKNIRFDGIFAFKYSFRAGTASAKMQGHLDDKIKSERLSEILALQNSITEEINKSLLSSNQRVLLDSLDSDKNILGRTTTNKIVVIKEGRGAKIGDFVTAVITEAYQHSLVGCIKELALI